MRSDLCRFCAERCKQEVILQFWVFTGSAIDALREEAKLDLVDSLESIRGTAQVLSKYLEAIRDMLTSLLFSINHHFDK
jgi:hypothetical protein